MIREACESAYFIANVEPHAVGPLESVVLEDEVIASVGRDHAALWHGEAVASLLEADSFHANERLIPLRREAPAPAS